MNELALFAGAGGGILGGHLLGWRTVCAVEWEAYPASVLCARQNDGLLPPFPVWDDVQTFDGHPWRGIVDVVSGGFPCQDISISGGGRVLMATEAECGVKWRGSFTKYSQDSCLWKTHQCSLLGDLEEFSETWPQWGLMRDGECWEQRTLEQTIRGIESGFVGQTFPTPDASCGQRGTQPNWTPKRKSGHQAQYTINQAVRDLEQSSGGKLNPVWLEWVMGWPMHWTDLRPSEMAKSHSAQQQLGKS